jgi:hypothetical protein
MEAAIHADSPWMSFLKIMEPLRISLTGFWENATILGGTIYGHDDGPHPPAPSPNTGRRGAEVATVVAEQKEEAFTPLL